MLKSFSARFFTLVELLIVIAVIAILASMLLPALNLARESGKRILCVGNQKQIGLAYLSYMSDYNDWLLCDGRWQAGDFIHATRGVLPSILPYLGVRDLSKEALKVNVSLHRILTCPSNPDKLEYTCSVAPTYISYGLNSYLANIVDNNRVRFSAKIADRAPSIGVMTDKQHPDDEYVSALVPAALFSFPSPRHNFGVNMLLMDGHVEWKRGYGINSPDVYWAYFFSRNDGANFGLSRGYTSTMPMQDPL